jgi:arsenate reductase
MAEGWARTLAKEISPQLDLKCSSAGLEAHGLNPHAVAIMQEFGVDISRQYSTVLSQQQFDEAQVIVSVCSHADANCPVIPHGKRKIFLPFDDPAGVSGTEAEITECFRHSCLEIKAGVSNLLLSLSDSASHSESSI